MKQQIEFAKIWINELKYPEAIRNKKEEAERNLKEYKREANLYNWNKSVIEENIRNLEIFIQTLEEYLQN